MAAEMIPPLTAPAFLTAAGWDGAQILPLAGDASFRRYFRVRLGSEVAVLMDAPPPHEDPRPFVTIARWLAAQGLPAPRVLAEDVAAGLVLLEDFGDIRMRETVDEAPDREHILYAQAVDLLIGLHGLPAAELPAYDRPELHREAGLLTEWYCPAVGVAPDEAGYRAAWDAVFDAALTDTPVTVLRDYHAENIMLTPGGLGLLDFQDALAGHPAYDLVSLLQDARRDVPQAVEAAMLERYLAATGVGEDFLTAYHVLGAQRNTKIVGIFTRLWRRDGKPRYPALAPRVWRYLERDLAQPALAPVRAWFDATLPPDLRGDPMAIGAR